METTHIVIAGIQLNIFTDYSIAIPESFKPFLAEAIENGIRITIVETDSIPSPGTQKSAYEGELFSIYEGRPNVRYYHDDLAGKNDNYLYAEYDLENRLVRIRYLKCGKRHIDSLSNLFFHIAWEEILMHESRMILHACCVRTELGGLLFSGPSGIGKSTQGELWKKYEDAFMINGDRPIIYRRHGEWIACGSPYAGSSRCYVQDAAPIRAIIMLKQREICSIRRLGIADAYRRIYAMLTVCDWDPKFMEALLGQLEQLITDIPVYELECTPDKDAVDLLKKTLSED